MKKQCIEGTWFEDFGKYRYGRGNLGFYHYYTRLPDVDKVNKTHGKLIKPLIRDLEWHYSYMMCVARGFSGFDEDEHYTSDSRVLTAKKKGLPEDDELILYKGNGTFKEYVDPLEYLFSLHDKPLGKPLYNNDAKNHVTLGARGGGKEMPDYQSVIVEDGEKPIGEIKVGDKVYGRNGILTNVVGVFPQGVKDVYELEFTDGRVVECGLDHQWTFEYMSKGIIKTLTTREILTKKIKYKHKKSGYTYKWRLPKIEPVKYSEKELPVHPYLVGAMLGDGTCTTGTLKIASEDKEILDRFRELLPNYDIKHDVSTTNNHTIVYRGGDKYVIDKYGANPFKRAVCEIGINTICKNKFIPEQYKYSSVEQRMELVRGLLDTDGSINTEGSIEFSNTSEQLVDDLAYVLRSLGIKCIKSKDTRAGQVQVIKGHECLRTTYWRLYINTSLPVFFLSRKLKRIRSKTHGQVCLKSIRKTHSTNQTCIMVDNEDHLFLTKDFIPTHNSLFHILAETYYDITFDGAKVYTETTRNNPNQILINVGAGIKGKSAKTLAFMKITNKFLKESPEAGTWGKVGQDDWEPCPFYKEMSGTFETDDERGWTNKFLVKAGNNWEERGTGSTVYHVSYSANKKTGAESGAGGRRSLIMYEEIGLFEDLLNAWGSDEAVVSVDGVQFAPRIGIGTSGNISTIKAAQKIFTHPKDYNCIGFKTGEDNHCFFLPAYIVDKRFKDKNGNTDLQAAKDYYDKKLEEKLNTNDAAIINNWKMNYPTKIEHMWIASEGELLPSKEAEIREKQLLKNNLYENIGTPIRLHWDNNHPDGVNYEVDPSIYAIYDDNFQDKESLEGGVIMYEQPFRVNNRIPLDAHIFTHDPYVSDAWDEGGSLGVTHVWINPKYIPQGAKGNCLAATYIGKHRNGLDGYNSTLEKLVAFYGNPMRNLWYEANRGERLRSHFIKRGKAYLLCLRPQFEQGQHIYLKNTSNTGFMVGSQVSKISMLDRLNDWLLEDTELEDGVLKNIFRIPCIFTIRQIKDYKLKGNFDAVSSCLGLPLALGEIEHNIMESINKNKNPFGKMTKFLKQRTGNG